ncbi:MAG: methionyl-tRNA formyltransferase [bacterium]|nr:methionyl-tRNA formyltransferase [bacterium]
MHYIYFGTSEFAATILEKLLDVNMAPVAVVTQPDRPAGRGKKIQESPVKKIAQNGEIPLLQPERLDADAIEKIAAYNADLFIVAAYGAILPKALLALPNKQTVNVHPSLLPLYRGPSPIQSTILNGEIKTGVTLILLDEEIDHGPILAQEMASIGYRDTSETLSHKLALQSALMLQKVLPEWLQGTISPTPQDHAKATFTKMITKEDGRIDWKKPAEEIERHVRAMFPWPSSYTFWKENKNEVRLHLRRVSVLKEGPRLGSDNNTLPGEVLDTPDDELAVVCGKEILVIHELQPEGKHIMPGSAFINGHRSIIGSILQ